MTAAKIPCLGRVVVLPRRDVALADQDGDEEVSLGHVERSCSIGVEPTPAAAGATVCSVVGRGSTDTGRPWPAEGGGVLSPCDQRRTGEVRGEHGVAARG